MENPNNIASERIAKLIARSGFCSRRQAEELILAGRVSYNGKPVESPAEKFNNISLIAIDGNFLKKTQSRLWLYHKPFGLVVSHNDEQGRETIFDYIPIDERVISVGRLDKNTSGLLLLTNDGALARKLELPANNFKRVYLVRVYGQLDFPLMKNTLSNPLTIEDITYRPIQIERDPNDRTDQANNWLKLTITEGKNREIRKIMEYFGLRISKLIRIQYGPFFLDDLPINQVVGINNWNEYIK